MSVNTEHSKLERTVDDDLVAAIEAMRSKYQKIIPQHFDIKEQVRNKFPRLKEKHLSDLISPGSALVHDNTLKSYWNWVINHLFSDTIKSLRKPYKRSLLVFTLCVLTFPFLFLILSSISPLLGILAFPMPIAVPIIYYKQYKNRYLQDMFLVEDVIPQFREIRDLEIEVNNDMKELSNWEAHREKNMGKFAKQWIEKMRDEYAKSIKVSDANINQVGPGTISTLNDRKIISAYDILYCDLSGIAGIGDAKIYNLTQWAKTACENFKVDNERLSRDAGEFKIDCTEILLENVRATEKKICVLNEKIELLGDVATCRGNVENLQFN